MSHPQGPDWFLSVSEEVYFTNYDIIRYDVILCDVVLYDVITHLKEVTSYLILYVYSHAGIVQAGDCELPGLCSGE